MTDFADIEQPSTVLDTEPAPAASGGGAPVAPAEQPEPKAEKPLSIRDSLDKAAKAVAAKPDPEEEKPESDKANDPAEAKEPAEPKPEPADEKADQPRQPEGKKWEIEAPSRLLPKHRELWRHVPHELRAEIDRLSKEDEAERGKLTEQTQRYQEIAEYDDLARQNGGSLKQSIERVHGLEKLFEANPLAALNQLVLENFPRKADGQPMSLIELARGIAQADPQQVHQMMRTQPQQQAPQPDPRVQQLEQEMQQMRAQSVLAQVIEPFRAQHPRYDELSTHIAKFLQTDIIPQTLGPLDRLAHAYDMAERLYPSHSDPAPTGSQGGADDRGGTSSGSKSIKSSPGSVSEDFGTTDRKVSIREAIEMAGKKVALRG